VYHAIKIKIGCVATKVEGGSGQHKKQRAGMRWGYENESEM